MQKLSKIFFYVTALAIVCGFGIFVFSSEAQAAINGILRVHPTNPRYFTDNSGKAIYLNGVDNFRALQDWNSNGVGAFDYQGFLDYLENYNHNFLRMWIWENTYYNEPGNEFSIFPPHIYKRTGSGNANDNLPKFDLNQFNQEYFNRLRQRVIDAGDQGIYVSIMLFQGWSVWDRDNWVWPYHPFHKNNNINGINGDLDNNGVGIEIRTLANSSVTQMQEKYVKKVIDTVRDLDNVLFEISNEDYALDLNAVADWQYHMVNLIHTYEQNTYGRKHPVGMSAIRVSGGGNGNPKLYNSPADYISPSHEGEKVWMYDPPIATGSKVIIADTDHIHPDQISKGGVGYHPWLWMCLTRGHSVNAVDGDGEVEDWFSEENSRVMADTARYANRMNLAAMVPSNNSSDCSTRFCLRNQGKEYLVYQPGSGQFTVNLQTGNYNYEWFNPDTGLVVSSGTVNASGGSKTFTSPFSGDAVLYLKIINPTDVNSDNQTNIKDIQACIKVITNSQTDTNIIAKCNALAAPIESTNIKDIQVIIRAILNS